MLQFNDYIYWTDWFKKSVMRVDKKTGKNVTAVSAELDTLMEIKAVSAEKQRGWNPCRDDNGGCSHLCLFRGPDYVCDCPNVPDERPCTKGNFYLTFFFRKLLSYATCVADISILYTFITPMMFKYVIGQALKLENPIRAMTNDYKLHAFTL